MTVNLGFSKRRIPYASIQTVQQAHTTLQLRLFGASWPGLHCGLYHAKDVGKVWTYVTTMTGDFIVITLLDGNKIAIAPENADLFYRTINLQQSQFGRARHHESETLTVSNKGVYTQIAAVAAAFVLFVGYVLWLYPSLPESIPVHFDLYGNSNRWGHKSELFLIVGVAAIFPIINTVVVLKYGRYGQALLIFLGVICILLMVLFFGIVYYTQSVI